MVYKRPVFQFSVQSRTNLPVTIVMGSGDLKFTSKLVLLGTFLQAALGVDIIDPKLTKINFYYGPTYKDFVSYNLSDAENVVYHPKFVHRRTTFYITDTREPQAYSFHYSIDAYNKYNKINFLVIDWGAPLVTDFSKIKNPDIKTLVPLIAQWILQLFKHIEVDTFHLLSYSRGVQVAGEVGFSIIKKTNRKVKLARITALAPRKDLKFNDVRVEDLKEYPACFIDAIHTDAGNNGTFQKSGHVDFWPNGGTPVQPGCKSIDDICSRQRSYILWAESVANRSGTQFCAYRATSYDDFKKTKITPFTQRALMGINCDSRIRGNYYLYTNDKSPYAVGCGNK